MKYINYKFYGAKIKFTYIHELLLCTLSSSKLKFLILSPSTYAQKLLKILECTGYVGDVASNQPNGSFWINVSYHNYKKKVIILLFFFLKGRMWLTYYILMWCKYDIVDFLFEHGFVDKLHPLFLFWEPEEETLSRTNTCSFALPI